MARSLVAIDLDGTMLSRDGSMSPAVSQAVRDVAEAGVDVVIATGRAIGSTMPIVGHLGLNHGFVICSNGAVTLQLDPAEPGGYRILEIVTFDPGPALEMLRGSWHDAEVAVEEIGVGFKVSGPFPDGELVGEVRVVPWSELEALIAPHYPKAGNGRQPVGLAIMLRTYFLQQWFALSDPAWKMHCTSRRCCGALPESIWAALLRRMRRRS